MNSGRELLPLMIYVCVEMNLLWPLNHTTINLGSDKLGMLPCYGLSIHVGYVAESVIFG